VRLSLGGQRRRTLGRRSEGGGTNLGTVWGGGVGVQETKKKEKITKRDPQKKKQHQQTKRSATQLLLNRGNQEWNGATGKTGGEGSRVREAKKQRMQPRRGKRQDDKRAESGFGDLRAASRIRR